MRGEIRTRAAWRVTIERTSGRYTVAIHFPPTQGKRRTMAYHKRQSDFALKVSYSFFEGELNEAPQHASVVRLII